MQNGILIQGDELNKRYVIKNKIAEGGIGVTYLAEDKICGSNVVLKVIFFSKVKDWKELELFEREAEILKNLNHSSIPDYIDNFEIEFKNEKLFVIVQEYIEGQNLNDLIKKGLKLPTEQVIKITQSLLETVSYIHNLQPPVIHRDINPKNIILDKNNEVYLVDFGAVGKINKDTHALSNTYVGTFGFMPEEQFYGKVMPASDIYGIGMTVVYLLTGKHPSDLFDSKNEINFHDYINVPDNFGLLLEKMIEKDYKKRIKNAKKALDFLYGKVETRSFDNLDNKEKIIDEHAVYQVNDLENGGKKIDIFPKKKEGRLLLILGIVLSLIIFGFGFVFLFGDYSEYEQQKGLAYFFLSLPFVIGLLILGIYNVFSNSELQLNKNEILYIKKFGKKERHKTSIKLSDYKGSHLIKKRVKNGIFYKLEIEGKENNIIIGKSNNFDKEDVIFIKELIEEHISNIFLV